MKSIRYEKDDQHIVHLIFDNPSESANLMNADFRASVAEFVERTLKPRAEQMLEVKSVDRDLWKEAGQQGLFGLDIPEEFGGMGADDYRFNAVAAEVLNGFNAAVGSCFGIHSDVCPPYIVDLGTQEQEERWLPGMANGELIAAIAMTEAATVPVIAPRMKPTMMTE